MAAAGTRTIRAQLLFVAILAALGIALCANATEDLAGRPQGVLLWESSAIDDPHHARHASVLLGIDDLSGDGIPDLVAAIAEHVHIYAGDGEGRFDLIQDIPLSDRIQMAADPYPHIGVSAGLLADLDDDGTLEILVGASVSESDKEEHGTLFVLASVNEQYELIDSYRCGWQPQQIVIDQHAEGSTEIWLANWTLTGDEVQRLTIRDGLVGEDLMLSVPNYRWNVASLHDINGDDLLDVVLTHIEEGVVVHFGRPDGAFREAQAVSDLSGISFVSFADIDGDGSDELIGSGTIGIAVIPQPWPAPEESAVIYDLGLAVRETAVGDFNGDGIPDVAAVADGGQRILVFAGLGNGELAPPQTFIPTLPVGWAGDPIVARDLDDDSAPDLVLTGHHGLRVMMNGGEEPWGTSQIPFGGDRLLGVGDVDLDGDVDILTQGVEGIDVLRSHDGTLNLESDVVSLAGQWCNAAIVHDGRIYALSTQRSTSVSPDRSWYRAFNAERDLMAIQPLEAAALPVLACGDLDGDGEVDVFGTTEEHLWIAWSGVRITFHVIGPNPSLVAAIDNARGHQDAVVVSTGEYANVLRVSFPGRQPIVSDPLIQLVSVPLTMGFIRPPNTGQLQPFLIAARFGIAEADGENVALVSGAEWVSLRGDSAGASPLEGFPVGELVTPFVSPVIADLDGDGAEELAYTTTLGDVIHVHSLQDAGSPPRVIEKGIGPLYAVDLDGNGIDDLIGSTLGWFPVAWIRWNGGKR